MGGSNPAPSRDGERAAGLPSPISHLYRITDCPGERVAAPPQIAQLRPTLPLPK
jgi:hypothetical protein